MVDRLPQGRTLRDNEPNAIQYLAEREGAKKNNPVYKQLNALAVDSGIAALPYALTALYLVWSERAESLSGAILLIHADRGMLIFFLTAFALLLIFKDITGRSIGQRVNKLHIIPTDGSEYVQKWKLIARNLLFFMIPLDALILVFTGKRLLDRLLKIDVVPKSK